MFTLGNQTPWYNDIWNLYAVKMWSYGLWRRVVLKVVTNVSGERIASIFRVEDNKTTRHHNP
jgi:hypothetical protein